MRRGDVAPPLEVGTQWARGGFTYEVLGGALHTEKEDHWMVFMRKLGSTALMLVNYADYAAHAAAEESRPIRMRKPDRTVPEEVPRTHRPRQTAPKDIEPALENGTYRHYKGGLYTAIGVAAEIGVEDSWLAVYRRQADQQLYARPYDMFVEHVDKDGQSVPRFEKIPESQI